MNLDGPALCEVMMDPDQPQIPKSVNRRDEAGNIKQTPIEDSWPYLPREEIEENLKV
jgi:acetolactate synthase-1/2/3 large subunit